jgi:adenylate cyclase
VKHVWYKALPLTITGGVMAALCLVRLIGVTIPAVDMFETVEVLTYDARMRLIKPGRADVSEELALVHIERDDEENFLKMGTSWPWPRVYHGELVRELARQGARVVGFDIFFPHAMPDPPGFDEYVRANRLTVEGEAGGQSDGYFGAEMGRAGNVVLAVTASSAMGQAVELQFPERRLGRGCAAVGHDGMRGLAGRHGDVLRLVPAFVEVKEPQPRRVWHLGLVMAAMAMGIDLGGAEVDPGRITMWDRAGRAHRIPVDRQNRFYVDWSVRPDVEHLSVVEPYTRVWASAIARQREGGSMGDPFRNKTVLVASTAGAQNIADIGATPIGGGVPLGLSHLNVANMLLLDRFVTRSPLWLEMLLAMGMAAASAAAGWRLRLGWSAALVGLATSVYLGLAWWLYREHRYWLPVAMPLAGAVAMTYVCLASYRVLLDRAEHRRVDSMFGRLVSPNTFGLLLEKQMSALDGIRRNITVYFADLRGFTRFVEERHARALVQGREQGAGARALEGLVDRAAREALATVNQYLACIADTVKAHDGTLDKYIGDCVMSFWGAPIGNEKHALACVRAAIAVHRAVHVLNLDRERQNQERAAGGGAEGGEAGEPLAILEVGSAINTGLISVGLMGSASHISNYTVFGREVNLTSRLQQVVGPGRIVVTAATRQDLVRYAPELAQRLVTLEPVRLRDIAEPVAVYEVDWRTPSTVGSSL